MSTSSLSHYVLAAATVMTVAIVVSATPPSSAERHIVVFSKTHEKIAQVGYRIGGESTIVHLIVNLEEGMYTVSHSGSELGEYVCYGPDRIKPDGALGDNTLQFVTTGAGVLSVTRSGHLGSGPPPPAPVITTDGGAGPGEDYSTTVPGLVLEGTCDGATTKTIRVNGSTVGVTYVPGEANWSYSRTLTEGLNTFWVTATDETGLSSTATVISIVLGDGTPPDPPPPAPVISTDGGNGAGVDYTTTSSSLLLEGTCDTAIESIRVNGSTLGVIYRPGETSWSYSGTLDEGPNVFAVTGTVGIGLTSPASSITITLDSTGVVPTPVILTNGGNGPGVDFTTNIPWLTLHGTCNSVTETIWVNGGTSAVAYTSGGTSWSYGQAESERVPVLATAFQNEGTVREANALTSVSALDDVWSPLPVDSATSDFYATGAIGATFDALSLEFSPENLDMSDLILRVYLQKGSGPSYIESWEHYRLLPGTFNAEDQDSYVVNPEDDHLPGGQLEPDTTVGWVELPFDANSDPLFIEPNGHIGVTLRLWNWRIDAVRLVQRSGSATLLVEGSNTFTVIALDAFGTPSGADTITVTLDTIPPAPPVITTDGGNGPGKDFAATSEELTLAGTCDPSTWSIWVNGSTSGVTYSPGDTDWQYYAWIGEGANRFNVNAQDWCGNTSTSAAIRITRGIIPRGVPISAGAVLCTALIMGVTLHLHCVMHTRRRKQSSR